MQIALPVNVETHLVDFPSRVIIMCLFCRLYNEKFDLTIEGGHFGIRVPQLRARTGRPTSHHEYFAVYFLFFFLFLCPAPGLIGTWRGHRESFDVQMCSASWIILQKKRDEREIFFFTTHDEFVIYYYTDNVGYLGGFALKGASFCHEGWDEVVFAVLVY